MIERTMQRFDDADPEIKERPEYQAYHTIYRNLMRIPVLQDIQKSVALKMEGQEQPEEETKVELPEKLAEIAAGLARIEFSLRQIDDEEKKITKKLTELSSCKDNILKGELKAAQTRLKALKSLKEKWDKKMWKGLSKDTVERVRWFQENLKNYAARFEKEEKKEKMFTMH